MASTAQTYQLDELPDGNGVARRCVKNTVLSGEARTSSPNQKVALFNLKYSQNLGDGVIALCLEQELIRNGFAPVSIDLAGRTNFKKAAAHFKRRMILALLERLPDTLRALLVPKAIWLVVRFRYAPRWRAQLSSCEASIIGGGALIADTDQNFPIKLSRALNLLAEANLPVAIAHVGVTGGWSRQGHERFCRAFDSANVQLVTVREPFSIDTWEQEFPELLSPKPTVALDPGILSRDCFGIGEERSRPARPVVGICITHPMVLRLHGDGNHNAETLAAWFRKLAANLAGRGCDIELFHNGSAEDEDFLQRVIKVDWLGPNVTRAPLPETPDELARYISTLDCVVGHRLHACIVAYSYCIPAIGLSWDQKVESFFRLTEREKFVRDWQSASPFELVDLVMAAMSEGVDLDRHRLIAEECRTSIEKMAKTLRASMKAAA